MPGSVAQLVPYALSGAFLPTWTLYVIVLLGTSRPLRNALAFVAGNAAWRLALGAGALWFLGEIPGVPSAGAPPGRGAALAYLVGGAALAVLGAVQLRRPDDPDRPQPAWMTRFEAVPPLLAFALGAGMCASPGIQWVYFLGGTNVIAQAGLGTGGEAALLVGFVGSLQLMLLAPVVVFAARRRQAGRALVTMKRWINGHANRITGIILLLVGVWLAVRGAAVLW